MVSISTKQKCQSLQPEQIKTLVIDDDYIILSLLEMILQSVGIEKIDVAEDGTKAISMLYDANPPYDLVLCDMNMPLKNGLEVHSAMRANEHCADAFFMLVTAVTEAQLEAINSGVNGYIAKPIEREMLIKKIAQQFPAIHVDNPANENA